MFAIVAGCSNPSPAVTIDAGPIDVEPIMECNCNLLTQTGCRPNMRCTWLVDATMPELVGHIGCVPEGPIGIGGACDYGPSVAETQDSCLVGSFDDCESRSVCWAGTCAPICSGFGMPMCAASEHCVIHPGFLGPVGLEAAGTCEPN